MTVDEGGAPAVTPAGARTPRFFEHRVASVAPQVELAAALSGRPPAIPPKFFYDALGSALFAAICELDEYYPTRTEAEILERHRQDIARAAGGDLTLIDLGAGDCMKSAALIEPFGVRQYVAVDISADFLRHSLVCVQRQHPELDCIGVSQDFSAGLTLPDAVDARRRLFFYPGSSIGNFSPDEARAFLAGLAGAMGEDGALLIGVDLAKEAAVLEPAYDDALGVTAAFNLNVLRHANRVLGSDFRTQDWRHVAFLHPSGRRIEMHLEARRDLRVAWPGGELRMKAGERIHTENSWKYEPQAFAALLAEAGLAVDRSWFDERRWFGVFLARPAPSIAGRGA